MKSHKGQRWTFFFVEWISIQVQSAFLARTEWVSFFCAYLYRHSVWTFQSSTIRSISSLISSRFIRRFARTWKYYFTFTEFILFPLHSQTSPLGFEKEQLCIVPIRIFSFARRYVNFPYNVFDRRHKFTSGHPSPHQKKKQTNNSNKQ